ncbi:MAG: hypothetical protein K6F39_01190 [Lachnospiraceae bacterium]|nr:hypothetical protein [Lachnospiraceae bacterium]
MADKDRFDRNDIIKSLAMASGLETHTNNEDYKKARYNPETGTWYCDGESIRSDDFYEAERHFGSMYQKCKESEDEAMHKLAKRYLIALEGIKRLKEELNSRPVGDIEEQFSRVKDYVYDHQGCTVEEVSKKCQADPRNIRQWVREGRLEYVNLSAALTCMRCGKPIHSGKYCPECEKIVTHTNAHGTAMNVPGSDTGEMRFNR